MRALLVVALITGCATPRPPCAAAWADTDAATRAQQPDESYTDWMERLGRPDCQKRWTVLLWMAADNHDMPPYAFWDLLDIEEGRLGLRDSVELDVLVHLDVAAPAGLTWLRMAEAPAPRSRMLESLVELEPADLHSPVARRIVAEDTPPGEQLRRFLDWGVRTHPSRHYLVVLWGHGQGWRADQPLEAVRYRRGGVVGGFGFDDSQSTVADIPAIRDALQQVSADRLRGRPVDVLTFDACLMQTVEVAVELSDVTRYLVASEQVQDYLGLPYPDLLAALPGSDPRTIAGALPAMQAVAQARADDERNPLQETRSLFTLSTLDTAALVGELLPALGELADALGTVLAASPGHAALLAHSLFGAAPRFLGGSLDLGVLLARLRADLLEGPPLPVDVAPLEKALAKTRAAIDETVLAFAQGRAYREERRWEGMRLRGLAVWLPRDAAELQARLEGFAASTFFADVGATDAGQRWPAWWKRALSPL